MPKKPKTRNLIYSENPLSAPLGDFYAKVKPARDSLSPILTLSPSLSSAEIPSGIEKKFCYERIKSFLKDRNSLLHTGLHPVVVNAAPSGLTKIGIHFSTIGLRPMLWDVRPFRA